MVGGVEPGSAIWQFVEKGFNSGDEGKRIFWFAETEDEKTAFHVSGSRGPSYIFVPKSKYCSPVMQWGMVVFELFNIRNKKAFRELERKGMSGEITAEVYADEVIRLEYFAMIETKEFFQSHPFDSAITNGDDWYHTLLNRLPSTAEAFLAALDSVSSANDVRTEYRVRMLEATSRPVNKTVETFLKLDRYGAKRQKYRSR